MADTNKHAVSVKLRAYAQKIAAEKSAAGEGAPDRMTIADGQGGITASKDSIPHDVGEDEMKRDQPTDGTTRTAKPIPEGGPDRMTVADGQGGITASGDQPKKDPGEEEMKVDQPTDGDVRKAAGLSGAAKRIRAALSQANPELGARIEKQAGKPAAGKTASAPEAAAPAEKKAGEGDDAPGAPSLEFSQDTLAKIASNLLSTQEGAQFVHDNLEKQAGEAAAREQIGLAMQAAQTFDHGEQVKQAAFNDFQEKFASIHTYLQQGGVTEEDAEEILKQAAVHQEKLASFEHPLLKAAYVQGMDDAALMSAADEAAGEEGVPPVDEAMPMGGEELSEEEIMALLEEMLASGEISEEDIMQAVAATEGGGELPPEGGGEELAPEAPMAEAPVEEPAMA